MPLNEELKALAEQLADAPDEVLSLVEDAVRLYRREKFVALGLMAVRSIAEDEEDVRHVDVDEDHPQIVAARERLRDRLKGILEWWKR